MNNPFYKEFATEYNSAPFDIITDDDFKPAIETGIKQHNEEINAIVADTAEPTFENTVVAYERSGILLDRVLGVFYPLLSAYSDDKLMEVSLWAAGELSKHSTSIALNRGLWEKVKWVYDHRDAYSLDVEDAMLLKKTYDSFVRRGALLEGEKREEYSRLMSELSELTTRFGQNVLKELNTYEIWLSGDDISGLPDNVVEEAVKAARDKGCEGEYLFTLQQPTYIAVMKYSDKPTVRERFYRLYNRRNTSGEFNNVEILNDIASHRFKVANLLGYDTYADFVLEKTMAEKPDKVYELLHNLAETYRPLQLREFEEIEQYASELEGKPVSIHPWDYSYYANKLRQARYSYDEELLRPYFELDSVITGVFGLATRLYGVTFTPAEGVQVYHPDVKVYRVNDADGSYLGLLYTDFFPRDNKRPGAWMTGFTDERITAAGEKIAPHVSLVMNFTKPTDTKPSLLTPSEVGTFLHEFGHALHGLFADTRYASMSGTGVYRDFVELPSQFNENFLTRKEFLDSFARHYVTGEPIPQEYVDMITDSAQFGAGYACLRQLGFGLCDMAWHTITSPVDDPAAFEHEAVKSVKMFPDVEGCLFSPQFSHIFSGGYAAGYYSYKWAEVLDADAFSLFEQKGLFDKATAESFRRNILSRGGTEHPMTLYRRFRGKEPSIDALLKRDGVIR